MFDCIALPPARRAPKSNAAKTVPIGWARPSNATVIASKPKEPAISAVSAYSLPSTWTAPPRPAKPPQIAMGPVKTNGTDIPAVLAALLLAPTARNL